MSASSSESSASTDNPGISSKQMFSSWNPSKGSTFFSFLRIASNSPNGPYLTQVISTGNILSAERIHSIIYVRKRGEIEVERVTHFYNFIEKANLIEKEAY